VSNRLLSLVWGAKPFGSERTGPSMRLVLAALADQVDEGKHVNWCYPSLLTIQERTEMGRRTVLRALANLKQEGWIRTESRSGYGSAYHFDLEKLRLAQRGRREAGLGGTRAFTAPVP
jgi:DNA-binding IclR family transcriptional regulator